MKLVNKTVFNKLKINSKFSHKGDNVVAGSRQYHGALQYTVTIASHFIDLIYVETDLSNTDLIKSLKKISPAIILVDKKQRQPYLEKADVVLIGPGLGRHSTTKQRINKLFNQISKTHKIILDADALSFIKPSKYTKQVIITPHQQEFKQLFKDLSVPQVVKQWPMTLVLKGATDKICQNKKCEYNKRGTAGLTKGGTGDVLVGLIGAFYCKSSAWDAGRAATLLIGLAAEDLSKQYGNNFSCIELIKQIPQTLHKWQKRKLKRV